MEQKIIEQGVKNLKEYGYSDVNSKNILTDNIFSAFFLSMLEDNLGKGQDEVINKLINQIKDTNDLL